MTERLTIAEHLKKLEEELLRPSVRQNAGRLRELLASDFEEVGASGQVFGREDIVELLSREDPAEAVIALDHFRVHWLTDELVQVRYQSLRRSPDADRYAERTSLWRHGSEGWTLIYHQGTPVPPR